MDPVALFVASLIPGCERGWENCATLGFPDRDGNLTAGIVYHDWSPEYGVIEISAASLHRNWCTKERLRMIFGYPFEQLGCRMVVARHSENNTTARRIWRALGAREIRIPKLRGPHEDEILSTLLREDWEASKFARGKNG